MNIDPVLAQFIVTAIVAVPVYLKMRSEWGKNNGDAYEALASALRTSGQTIDDLFKMLSEVPALKQQLDDVQDELDDLRLGVGILTTQLLKRNITPEWHPRAVKKDKAPTRPVKSSGFGRK